MVGFDPSQKNLSKLEHAFAGGFSGGVTRFICQPLDVLKIRFQLQVEPLAKGTQDARYWSVVQASKRIVKEEGITALWKGHIPAQLLSITYGIVQFVSFEILTKHAWHLNPEENQTVVYFFCGAAAGCLATLVSFPFDVVRTRLVAQGEPKIYRNVRNAFGQVYVQEGSRAFFKGLFPTLLQVAPHTGVQFAAYQLFNKLFWKRDIAGCTAPRRSVTESLVCGSLSGICAKSAVYPLDLARKRLQVQGFEKARKPFGKVFKCNGLVDCVRLTVKEEKIKGLFKGFGPSIMKAGFTTALHFSVYEHTCHALESLH